MANKDNDDQCIVSSSSIGVQGVDYHKIEPLETFDSLEPVKPPRLKKLARLQKEKELGKVVTKEKPDISSPILMTSTLNPNDMDAHRMITKTVSNSVLRKVEQPNSKITFKDLKRYASTSLASLSSNLRQVQQLGRSSFYYEADNSQDLIYEEKITRQVSPTYSEHIYEEIPDHRNEDRPLPPIPETSAPNAEVGQKDKVAQRRNGSIFEGASKYEILHYLKDAKDRISQGKIFLNPDIFSGFHKFIYFQVMAILKSVATWTILTI